MTTERYLDMVKNIIKEYVKSYPIKVYLYGSHAKGKSHRFSDIDVALSSLKPLPISFISTLKEIIEESTIPYSVDIVDLSEVDPKLRKKILSEGIEWKD